MTRVSLGFLFCAACAREQPTVAPIGESASPPAPSPARTYHVEADGRTEVVDDAPLVRIRLATSAAKGTFTVDPRDLAATRGEVKIDLATLRSRTFETTQHDDALATSARTWLEVAVDERIDERMRWAVFRITAIDAIDPSRDALTIPPLSGGGDVRRSVTLTARGDLVVHGHAVPKTAKLRAELGWPRDADRGPPSTIAIQSVEPMRVTLAEHGIVARDVFGKEDPKSAHLWGTKVGPTADVILDISAR